MTLPHSTVLTATDKVCRYTGVDDDWECAADSFNVGNSTITRNNITQLSDWATGNNVGPTAITRQSMRQAIRQPVALFAGVALLLGFTGVVLVTRRRRA